MARAVARIPTATPPGRGTDLPTPAPPAGCLPQRVLIVEDSPLIADDLAMMLDELGVPETMVAINAGEARRALAERAFDLVLLDVSLGDARADILLPDLVRIPVVLVTARLAEELPPSLAGLPLVSKPVQPEDVAALLRRYAGTASGHSML